MPKITNIAGYKFAKLADLKSLRQELLELCKATGLKGTILLSTEGVNLFVAGDKSGIETLLERLRGIPELGGFEVKFSESDHQPFNRMLVRIKKEIIAFGVEGINPAERTSPKLPAPVLKQWLDEGKPVTLLDTRNDYEVKLGTFKGALPIGVDHFRDFPEAVRKLPPEMKEQPIVMFCTGGIRCEKAGPFMEREGFKNIYQLDGGILKYFELCGGAHYEGECFVFDQRVGVDPSLHETESAQCYQCLTPLAAEEQRDPRYIAGKSCPYCFRTSDQEQRERLVVRQRQFNDAVTPLPGSEPYDNFRPISIPPGEDGSNLGDCLARILPHVEAQEWAELSTKGLLLGPEREPVKLSRMVRVGERYFQKIPNLVEPAVNGKIVLLHEDEALVVIDKPAPLPMHAGGRYNRNTLQHILNLVYHPQRPRPAHRLDANTTGIVLIARTRHFAAKLQPQFARGEVRKVYLALVNGQPPESTFVCDVPICPDPSEAGARDIDLQDGLPARTEFKVLENRPDGKTLLEARPITGRTNQIRAHLWQLGFPIVGDSTYLAGGEMAATQTHELQSKPLCLHAHRISFTHPLTMERVEFTSAAPAYFHE